ncbi:hypothetical protein B0T14DRAFT_571619 [Immersiella caudata]|uniref:Uncharacterized protein n=1 Tax=Immersiella caudata TaxID=314043 RepID=A0AA39WC42_9PEZI|nr:hypothetical protein B0T14DRAFT_571619 [Immersiella caudata]
MSSWFPICQDESGGWRLDIVALLAVTGDSFIGEHAQALTSSTLCLLPRIMPAPHALLQPRRPTSLPAEGAKVTSVYGDTVLDSVPFFANIIHPIDQLRPFSFRQPGNDPENGESQLKPIRRQPTIAEKYADMVSNAPQLPLRRTLTPEVHVLLNNTPKRYAIPPALYSPLQILSVFSFLMSIGLIIAGIIWKDGTAVVAVCLLSLSTSVIGYAAWWSPLLMARPARSGQALPGDVIIRSRESAVLLIKCKEEIARELYAGLEECHYVSTGAKYRIFMTLGAILMMPSVILLGNCTFRMQLLVGAFYLFLNVAYWVVGMLPLRYSWDLSRYMVQDITPADAESAYFAAGPDPYEGVPTLARTLCGPQNSPVFAVHPRT